MKEKNVEMELQKELAKGWSKENSVPIEISFSPIDSTVKLESAKEETKELGKFLKDKMSIRLTAPQSNTRVIKKRGRSEEHKLEAEYEIPPRGDSSEPTNSKELQLNNKARETLPQQYIKNIMYTNEIERVLHEFGVSVKVIG
jgi:hypothetical protein